VTPHEGVTDGGYPGPVAGELLVAVGSRSREGAWEWEASRGSTIERRF
jgi:hypothetical protein